MEKPGYYAVISADVRYDKDVCANAKLLYGEITALCNKEGYCWATNNYFATLYEVSNRSITEWISQLINKEYIVIAMVHEKKKTQRQIRLPVGVHRRKLPGGVEDFFQGGIEENFQHNITSINNTRKNKREKFIPPTIEEIREYCKGKNYFFDIQQFFDTYTESDWHNKDGKKMQSWKKTAVTWHYNNKKWNENKGKDQYADIIQEFGKDIN